ncbi:DUF4383 domain-containing protein [Nocardia thailandica]|uniref:DUF4383 domain-containing protein n=1 Tax=Nocardia thailandica TaxID=257275 RepID=A0ABW6PWB7_9NOCA|nr:DUF4383 domain-containing protein [Nocardia thailandica]
MVTRTGSVSVLHSPVQLAALVVGVLFLLAGVLGFVPGITTGFDSIEWSGHHSGAELFGLFQVSVLHNIVHLLFGVLGVAACTRPGAARTYLLAGGAVYLVLWLYGLAVDQHSDANFVPTNTADNYLHFGLGLGMLLLGLILPRFARPADPLSDRQPGIIE